MPARHCLRRCWQFSGGDFLLDLFLGGARADRCAMPRRSPEADSRPGPAGRARPRRRQQAHDPQDLRDHGGVSSADWLRDPRGPRCETTPSPCQGHPEPTNDRRAARSRASAASAGTHVERIDADMGAIEQRRTRRPQAFRWRAIAGQLVRAADRAVEELAHQHVDADQHGGQQHQRAAEPQPHWAKRRTPVIAASCIIPSPSERAIEDRDDGGGRRVEADGGA